MLVWWLMQHHRHHHQHNWSLYSTLPTRFIHTTWWRRCCSVVCCYCCRCCYNNDYPFSNDTNETVFRLLLIDQAKLEITQINILYKLVPSQNISSHIQAKNVHVMMGQHRSTTAKWSNEVGWQVIIINYTYQF